MNGDLLYFSLRFILSCFLYFITKSSFSRIVVAFGKVKWRWQYVLLGLTCKHFLLIGFCPIATIDLGF